MIDPIAPPIPTTNPLVMKIVNIHVVDAIAAAVKPISPAVIVPPINSMMEIIMAPNAPATIPLMNPVNIPPSIMIPTIIPAMNSPILIPIKPMK